MKLVKPSFIILDDLNGPAILKKIERIARECYQSLDVITTDNCDSAIRLIRDILIKNGHWAMIEHGISFSVLFQNCDRGFAHELVRHRLCSFAQESTRYCNYSKNKFGKEISFVIQPFFENPLKEEAKKIALETWQMIETNYMRMIESGATAEEARCILPIGIKSNITCTANLREWEHIFSLRCAKDAHPLIRSVMTELLNVVRSKIPIIFDHIIT